MSFKRLYNYLPLKVKVTVQKRHVNRAVGIPLIFAIVIFWASLIAQLVKNPPVMQETLV